MEVLLQQNKMIIAIRIRGMVGIRKDVEGALNILRLRKKYSCVLVDEKDKSRIGMLNKVKDCISYGEISEETRKELILKRGRLQGDKHVKDANDKNIKPFFRLHPPIGGFKKSTKLLYPKGVLGKNEKINELLRRML